MKKSKELEGQEMPKAEPHVLNVHSLPLTFLILSHCKGPNFMYFYFFKKSKNTGVRIVLRIHTVLNIRIQFSQLQVTTLGEGAELLRRFLLKPSEQGSRRKIQQWFLKLCSQIRLADPKTAQWTATFAQLPNV